MAMIINQAPYFESPTDVTVLNDVIPIRANRGGSMGLHLDTAGPSSSAVIAKRRAPVFG
jgi:hypothetical protein